MLKYHNLVIGIAEGLETILINQKSPAKVISTLFATHKKWGKKDRNFVAETIYDMVRWKSRIEAAQEEKINQQNLFASIGVWFILKGETQLPDFKEFKGLDPIKILEQYNAKKEFPKVKYSFPDWLYNYGKNQLGETQWQKELEELNTPAKTILRCNTQKISLKKLQESLLSEAIETDVIEGYPHALALKSKQNILNSQSYKNGLFQIQDASSQLVAPFLQVETNQLVIDACAGAGGKSLHLSNLMQNQGKIIAMDIYGFKLAELERRKKLSGDKIIKIRLIKNNEDLIAYKNTADRVLLDVPCSSMGVLRRNPAIKWNLSAEKLEEIILQQESILNLYATLLKPTGGILVYSTCSIFPTENQDQVQKFLQTNSNFKLLEQKIVLPSASGFDGFYMASLSN